MSPPLSNGIIHMQLLVTCVAISCLHRWPGWVCLCPCDLASTGVVDIGIDFWRLYHCGFGVTELILVPHSEMGYVMSDASSSRLLARKLSLSSFHEH